MTNSRKLKRVFAPGDILPVILVIAGILIAIFIKNTALTLLGAGVAIIGIIGYIMNLSRRMNDFVETKFNAKTPSQPNFKITEKKDSSAKRQTIEDFEDNIEEGDLKAPDPMKNVAYAPKDINSSDEGFRIIVRSKDSTENIDEKKEIQKEEIKVEVKQEKLKDLKLDDTSQKKDEIAKDPEQNKDQTIQEEAFPEENKIDEEKLEEEKKDFVKKKIDLTVENLMVEAPDHTDEPRKEFEYCLSKILMAIRSVSNTSSAVFMLYNSRKQNLKIEAYVTDSPDCIKKSKRAAIGNDIISQIIQNGKPEILTEINPSSELELIPYYVKERGVVSFIGVPVFFNGEVIGVLCADSEVEDAYDSIIANFFGHFTKLIATLLNSYIEKYDLIQARKTLNGISIFTEKSLDINQEDSDIFSSLIETVKNVIDCDLTAIVSWNDDNNEYFISDLRTEDNEYRSLINSKVDPESEASKSIKNVEIFFTSEPKEVKRRFSKDEPKIDQGVSISIPIMLSGSPVAALLVETKDPNNVNSEDIETLRVLTTQVSNSLEMLRMNSTIEKASVYDLKTGILNKNAFNERLDQEFARSKTLNNPMSACLFAIDRYESFDDNKSLKLIEKAKSVLVDLLKNNIRPFDIIAENEDEIALILPGMDENQAKLFSEKIRNEIAVSLVEIEDKKFNITSSIGVNDSSHSNSADEFIQQINESLIKAKEKTNSVVLFA